MKAAFVYALLLLACLLWVSAAWVHWYGAETYLVHSNAPRNLMLRVLSISVPAGAFTFISAVTVWRAGWARHVAIAVVVLAGGFLAWAAWMFSPAIGA